jgi:YggT family protein
LYVETGLFDRKVCQSQKLSDKLRDELVFAQSIWIPVSMSDSASIAFVVLQGLQNFLQIYIILLIIRVLLSWFPTIDWMTQPFALLSQITEPFLGFFRRFIPPLGMFDISSLVAILSLQFLQRALSSAMIASLSVWYG